jgi:SAM-dependent methyltransferase
MERREYERLAAVEERGWWFQGLRANLVRAWQSRNMPASGAILLDAGCGTGGLLTQIVQAAPAARCYGLELDPGAAETARAKSGATLMVGSVLAPPLAAQSCDVIFSADVLCHRGVEPAEALAALAACLKPRGVLLLNLPAYRWLFSGRRGPRIAARRRLRRDPHHLLEQPALSDDGGTAPCPSRREKRCRAVAARHRAVVRRYLTV